MTKRFKRLDLIDRIPEELWTEWALGSITTNKASGDDGIPVELFRILKDDAVKVLHSIRQHIWRTQRTPQNSQFSFQSHRKAIPKNVPTTAQFTHLICWQSNAQNSPS